MHTQGHRISLLSHSTPNMTTAHTHILHHLDVLPATPHSKMYPAYAHDSTEIYTLILSIHPTYIHTNT